MSIARDMHNLLIYYFGKYHPDSNWGKLLEVYGKQFQDIDILCLQMINALNPDYASGANLDLLGEDIGLTRGSLTDDEYRRRIKIEQLANRSTGDVATVEEAIKVIYGDSGFAYIQATYDLARYSQKPAGAVFGISTNAEFPILIPDAALDKIPVVGVSRNYEIVNDDEIILIDETTPYELLDVQFTEIDALLEVEFEIGEGVLI